MLSYLESLRGDHRLAGWQAVQAVHALELLFCELLGVDWRREVDWEWWKAAFRALEPAHPTVARENRPVAPRVVPAADGTPVSADLAAIRKAHPAVLNRLVTEIRRRRYSIRTEQAYEAWVCRFIAFHANRAPTELGKDAIVAFLEHLAVQRNVAASTQNQALNALVFLYQQVLEQPPEYLGEFARAKRPKRLPVVLSQPEAR